MNKNREEDYKIIKILFLVGAIFSIILGIKHITNLRYILAINQMFMSMNFNLFTSGRYIFKFIYILFGIVEIIGGIFLLKYRNMKFEDLRNKSNEILTWGVFLLFANFIGGITSLVAYYFIIRDIEEINKDNFHKDNIKELEKAYNLKEKGIITEEEYIEIKRRILNS